MFIIKKLSDNSKEFLNTYYDIVDQLEKEISGVEIGKSISELFIKQIVPFFNASVKMNDNILKYTTNVDVENFAKNTSEEHQQNADSLLNMLESCACACNSERDIKLYTRKFEEPFNSTLHKLNSSPATNNLDAIYITSKINLLDGIVMMTKNVMVYGICQELKDFIPEMIESLNLNISTLKSLLKNVMWILFDKQNRQKYNFGGLNF